MLAILTAKRRDSRRRLKLATHNTIGSGPDNTLYICDPKMARHHAVLRKIGEDEFEIQDLGHGAGIVFDGKKVTVVRLTNGDVLTMGDTTFTFNLTTDPRHPFDRGSDRLNCDLPTRVIPKSGKAFSARTINLSLGGARITPEGKLAADDVVVVEIRFPSGSTIKPKGRVIFASKDKKIFGISFLLRSEAQRTTLARRYLEMVQQK